MKEKTYKPSLEYKIIYLYFHKQFTLKEISMILDMPLIDVSKIAAIEDFETKKQKIFNCFVTPNKKNGKIKLN
jgi:hypothetical protein